MRYWTAVLCLSLLLGCSNNGADQEMYSLAVAVKNLSSAVEGAVRYENVSPNLGEEELLKRATAHDRSLIQPFIGYTVRIMVRDLHAIVLVCTKDGLKGLLEDAACSEQFDAHLWKKQPPVPCAFTVRIEDVCKTR